ncbi:MAG: hypothetical protein GXO87_13335, partial [Chlorobi bacterium]|nr:hypothetical protein [Chlorobiota bacterium]
KKGTAIQKGDLIGRIDEETLGANVHASISGAVTEVNNDFVIIENV